LPPEKIYEARNGRPTHEIPTGMCASASGVETREVVEDHEANFDHLSPWRRLATMDDAASQK